jgi:glycosyltransferase involved in cell wall biosynthesis
MIKVVWICHFSNHEVQKHLPLVKKSPQYAPWISLLIQEFKENTDIELHIIAPFRWLKKDTYFQLDGIHYHFIKTGIPFVHRHWPAIFKFDFWTYFYLNRRKIRKTVEKIKPEIINLHGTENTYFSSAIFDLKKYPVLITIQGLFSFTEIMKNDYRYKVKLKTELRILKEFNNYGIRAKFLEDYISSKNPNSNFFWYKYPFKNDFNHSDFAVEKTYDVVFFAILSKDKGIEDLIKSIKIVKQTNNSISVKIIGTTNDSYFSFLKKLVRDLDLVSNIEFLGYLATQEEVHNWVSKAKICVLPTYNDIIPGTIVESLFLKIPVIAYAANGVVDFNFKEEIIRLVEVGNLEELARQITILLTDNELRVQLSIKAYQYAIENFDNALETKKLIDAYRKVIIEFSKIY